jgi:hypothetical protein
MKETLLQSEINKLNEELRRNETAQTRIRILLNRVKLHCSNFIKENKVNPVIVKDLTEREKKNIAKANKFATDIMRLLNFK